MGLMGPDYEIEDSTTIAENYEIRDPTIPPLCPRCGYRHSTMHEVAYTDDLDPNDEYPNYD